MGYLCEARVKDQGGHIVKISDRLARLLILRQGIYDDDGHIYEASVPMLEKHLDQRK